MQENAGGYCAEPRFYHRQAFARYENREMPKPGNYHIIWLTISDFPVKMKNEILKEVKKCGYNLLLRT